MRTPLAQALATTPLLSIASQLLSVVYNEIQMHESRRILACHAQPSALLNPPSHNTRCAVLHFWKYQTPTLTLLTKALRRPVLD